MKRADGEETRRKIPWQLYSFSCVRGITLRPSMNIMNKVGLTKGSLYAHFKSKGEILLSITARRDYRAVPSLRMLQV